MDVRDQDHVDLEPGFHGRDIDPFLVQEERRNVHRNLDVDRGAVLLHRLFLDDAKNVQCRGFRSADESGAAAARAWLVRALAERRSQALSRQFHQSEAGNLSQLNAGAVITH